MKRKLCLALVVVICVFSIATAAEAAETKQLNAAFGTPAISIYIDGTRVFMHDVLGNSVFPFIVDGTTYLPLRGVSETLGLNVGWDGNTKSIYITGQINYQPKEATNYTVPSYTTKTIPATYCDIKIYINGTLFIPQDVLGRVVDPFISNGTTYVPIRAISQAFGAQVDWEGSTNTINITVNDTYPNPANSVPPSSTTPTAPMNPATPAAPSAPTIPTTPILPDIKYRSYYDYTGNVPAFDPIVGYGPTTTIDYGYGFSLYYPIADTSIVNSNIRKYYNKLSLEGFSYLTMDDGMEMYYNKSTDYAAGIKRDGDYYYIYYYFLNTPQEPTTPQIDYAAYNRDLADINTYYDQMLQVLKDSYQDEYIQTVQLLDKNGTYGTPYADGILAKIDEKYESDRLNIETARAYDIAQLKVAYGIE